MPHNNKKNAGKKVSFETYPVSGAAALKTCLQTIRLAATDQNQLGMTRSQIEHHHERAKQCLSEGKHGLAKLHDKKARHWSLVYQSALHLRQGEHKDTISFLNQALQHHAERLWALALRGSLYLKLDNLENGEIDYLKKAESDFTAILKVDHKCFWVLFRLQKVYQKQGKAGDADATLRSALTYRGESYYHQRSFDKALRDFTNALKDPIASKCFYAFLQQDNTSINREKLTKFLTDQNITADTKKQFSIACAGLGRIYMERLKLNLAERYFNAALEVNPFDLNLDDQLAETYRLQGKHIQSKRLFLQALENKLLHSWVLPRLAIVHIKLWEEEMAESILSSVKRQFLSLENEPSPLAKDRTERKWRITTLDTMSLTALGEYFAYKGEYLNATACFDQALTIDTTNIEALIAKGELHRKTGLLDKANNDFTAAIIIKPNSLQALSSRGKLMATIGKPLAAKADFLAALKINPEYYDANSSLGEVYRMQGNKEKALECFRHCCRQAAHHQSYSCSGYTDVGQIYMDAGSIDTALSYFTIGLRYKKRLLQTHVALAGLHLMKGQLKDAMFHCNKVINHHSNHYNVMIIKSKAYQIRGKAHNMQQRVDLSEKDLNAAECVLNKAIEFNPYHYLDRGDYYLKTGRLSLALIDFNKVLNQDPFCLPALARRGETQRLLGNFSKAKFDFDEAIKVVGKANSTYLGYVKVRQVALTIQEHFAKIGLSIPFNYYGFPPRFADFSCDGKGNQLLEKAKLDIDDIDIKLSSECVMDVWDINFAKAIQAFLCYMIHYERTLLEYMSEYTAIDKSNECAYALLGAAHSLSFEVEESKMCLLRSLSINDSYACANACLGTLYLYYGEAKQAKKYLDKAISQKKDYCFPLISRAQVYLHQGLDDQAESDIKKLTALMENNSPLHHLIDATLRLQSEIYKRKGRLQEALTTINSLSDKTFYMPYFALSGYLKIRQSALINTTEDERIILLDSAQNDLNHALPPRGNYWFGNIAQGLLYRKKAEQYQIGSDKYTKYLGLAKNSFDVILKEHPDDPYALAYRAEIYLMTDKPERAESDLVAAISNIDKKEITHTAKKTAIYHWMFYFETKTKILKLLIKLKKEKHEECKLDEAGKKTLIAYENELYKMLPSELSLLTHSRISIFNCLGNQDKRKTISEQLISLTSTTEKRDELIEAFDESTYHSESSDLTIFVRQ